MIWVSGEHDGYVSAILFGLGIGGVLTVLPIAWADYFGRTSFGAIRGIALTIQVAAQAVGPVMSGVLRDATGDYRLPLLSFASFAVLAIIAALFTRAPKPPVNQTESPA